MVYRIGGVPRDYAWGSVDALPRFLGVEPTGDPQAELWLGTHPGWPTTVREPGESNAAPTTLSDVVKTDDGPANELPYLLKVLAAGSPLSLQAHPSDEQAREGFTREDAAGIPLDAPHRNYRDPHAKPEIIMALEDGFDALCGFRDPAESAAALRALAATDAAVQALADRVASQPLDEVFAWLLTEAPPSLVDRVCELAATAEGEAAERVRLLAAEHPGDPGILVALLLNRVRLRRGEALFLPARVIHMYLGGIGVELMGASDNVLRGGLTSKHVDVPELLAVLDFAPTGVPLLKPEPVAEHVDVFRPAGVGFELLRASEGAELSVPGHSIVLCTRHAGTVRSDAASLALRQGEAAFVPFGRHAVATPSGDGELVVATVAKPSTTT